MFRILYRMTLLLGGVILALFIAANLINLFDPYRVVTDKLVDQMTAEPQRITRLNAYGSLASQIRQNLHTEEAVALTVWLDKWQVVEIIKRLPLDGPVDLLADGVNMAVRTIATLDTKLVSIWEAESLSRNLGQLYFYDLDNGDRMLAALYEQSKVVSTNLEDVSAGLNDVATAVSTVTTMPGIEKLQQSVGKVARPETEFIYQSIESWQGVPANMWSVKQQIDSDVAWLNSFEQDYETAKAFNDRWQFDTLRVIPRFTAEFYRPLLWGVIGNLLLAIVFWRRSSPPLTPAYF